MQRSLRVLGFLCLLMLIAACGQVSSTASADATATRISPTSAPSTVLAPTAVASATTTTQTAPTTATEPTAGALAASTATPLSHSVVVNAPLVNGPPLRTAILEVGGQTLTVEIASTPEQRQIGLMSRPSMPVASGMLFVFPDDQPRSFWMRNTLIPLSIAFIDSGYTILNIEDMQALDDQTFHLSQGPARYALEVNQGWFATNNIRLGDRVNVTLPPDLEIR